MTKKPGQVRCSKALTMQCPNDKCEARRLHRPVEGDHLWHWCYCCGAFKVRCVAVKREETRRHEQA